MKDIAIVGIDCRFPQAPDADALWRLLMAGDDGVTEVPADRWRVDDYYDADGGPGSSNTTFGGFIDDADIFDHEFFAVAPREASLMDPQQRLLLHAAWRALEDATLDPRSIAGTNTGVFVGVMANEWANIHLADYAGITPQHGSGNGYFMTANRLSYHLDLKGPSMAIDTACSSSLVAAHWACQALRSGECDTSLAAGVNLVLTPALNIFYTQAGLSAPDGRCKPFSAEADGIGRCEGVAVLVLRRLDDAVAQGLPIYAVIEGGAVNSDGRSNGLTAPNRWSQQQVVAAAYAHAGVKPEEISFIEAHGTGTVLGDMIEAKALGELHRVERAAPCAIGSIKGNLGHAEGAAGIAALIKTALSLHHRVVPPSRFADSENPRLRLGDNGLRLLAEPLELGDGVVHTGVSSFGIGGTNAHVVLRSAPTAADVRDAPEGGGLLTLSAPNREGLQRAAHGLADAIACSDSDVPLPQLCWSSNVIKSSGRHRLAIAAFDREQAVEALREAAADQVALQAASGVARAVATGWLFTGQGSQHAGMGRALFEHAPAFAAALADVDRAMSGHLGRSVRELLLDEERGGELDRTELAQPAIFALEFALARALADVGVEPGWLLGHSVGEYAAAAYAGVFALDDACKLIVARGRLMQALPEGGAMVAVRTTPDEATAAIGGDASVAIAAINTTRDVVVSGPVAAVEAICARLAQTGAALRPLPVSHALHSPLMEPMVEEFRAVAATVTYEPPAVPIYSTARGLLLDVGEVMDADYWAEQIVATVRFADALGATLETEPTHLIEVGPRPVLAPLVVRMSLERPVPVFVPCPGPRASGHEFDETVGALYRDGLNPNWDALYEPESRVRRRLGGYEFSKEHRSWVQATATAPERATQAAASTQQAASGAPFTPALRSEATMIDQVAALFREQTAVLAALAGAPGAVSATPAAFASERLLPPAAADTRVVAGSVRAEIAKVSGFPEDALDAEQRLGADLGFDSIMVTDLVGRLSRAFPDITIEPHIFESDISIGDLAAHLGSRLSPAGSTQQVTPISTEDYLIEEFPEVVEMLERIRTTTGELGVDNPYFLINDGVTRDTSVIGGAEVVNFSSYNYLGLSGHTDVTLAVQRAVARYGSSVSSSRMLSGEKPVHQELEAELAALLGCDDAIALVSGHATNVTIIGHLVGPGDLIIHDALAHNSIVQGAELSGATRRPFPHNDADALDAILSTTRHQYRRVLIVIEGVYSQDGDIADLPGHIEVKLRHHALLMIDEAHSIGVLGEHGAGIGEHFGVDRSDVELWSGTMSKSLASCGGYVAGSAPLIQYLKYTTPGFIFSAGITPANAAAALAALRQMAAEPELLATLRRNSELFLKLAQEAGVNTADSKDTPIIPCIVGDSFKTLQLSNALLRRGVNVNPILYPAVPEELARLRFFITSCHTEDQIRSTVKILSEELSLLVK